MKHLKSYKYFTEDVTANASNTTGMGNVVSAQPGTLPGTFGTDGSGDVSFYLEKGKRKKGNPSQVSDAQDLAPVKTNKIKESAYTEDEYFSEISNDLKKYNIRPVELVKILDFYEDEILSDMDSGQPPFNFVNKITKDLELDKDGGFMSQKVGLSKNQTIKYL